MRFQLFALALALLASHATAGAQTCSASSGPDTVPLVELYTAEGCSDCPPADAWLSRLAAAEAPEDAIPLALHVDYWDTEGWPDAFADAAYTQRQDFRLKLARKKVRYTPQVMVGAQTGVNWRDRAEFTRLLARLRKSPAAVALSLRAERAASMLRMGVAATPTGQRAQGGTPGMLWLALYQDDLTSRIADGENKGRTLHHDRVARGLHGPWRLAASPVEGTLEIPLPAGASEIGKLGLVLFAESATTGEGLQAVELPLSRCAP